MNTILQPLALLSCLLLACSPAGWGGASPSTRPGEIQTQVTSSPAADESGLSLPDLAAAQPPRQGAPVWDAQVLGKPVSPLAPAAAFSLPILSVSGSNATLAAARASRLTAGVPRLHVLKCVWRC